MFVKICLYFGKFIAKQRGRFYATRCMPPTFCPVISYYCGMFCMFFQMLLWWLITYAVAPVSRISTLAPVQCRVLSHVWSLGGLSGLTAYPIDVGLSALDPETVTLFSVCFFSIGRGGSRIIFQVERREYMGRGYGTCISPSRLGKVLEPTVSSPRFFFFIFVSVFWRILRPIEHYFASVCSVIRPGPGLEFDIKLQAVCGLIKGAGINKSC